MEPPKIQELFQALRKSNYCNLQLVRSCIAATSIISPYSELKDSEKSYFTSVKSGKATVKLSVNSKAIFNLHRLPLS